LKSLNNSVRAAHCHAHLKARMVFHLASLPYLLSSSGPHQDHLSMRNPGLVENRANAEKIHSFIETDHLHLGVEVNLFCASPPRCSDGARQELLSDASSPVAFYHRHAAYLRAPAAYHKPGRSHGIGRCESQKMNRSPIVAVHLKRFRHALFSDEDSSANRESFRRVSSRRNSLYSYALFHRLGLPRSAPIFFRLRAAPPPRGARIDRDLSVRLVSVGSRISYEVSNRSPRRLTRPIRISRSSR
jgi:hypothetical protein